MSDDAYISPFVHLMDVPPPQTVGAMSMSSVWGSPARLQDDANKALQQAKAAHEAMSSFFASEPPLVPERHVTVCDANLRHILPVAISQQSAITSNHFPLGGEEFSWTSMLIEPKSKTARWTSPYASLDAVFTAVALAGGHMRTARATLSRDWTPGSAVEASKSLRAAAGVFMFAQEHIVPRLRSRGSGLHPPEVLTPVLQFMASSCMAQAQQCAVMKAEEGGKAPSLLARLEAGVADKYQEAKRHLSTAAPGDSRLLDQPLLGYVELHLKLATGMSLMHSALDANGKSEYALAIGYARDAVNQLRGIRVVDYAIGDTVAVNAINAAVARAETLYSQYKSDGDSVYFVMGKPSEECAMAAPAVIVQPTKFDMDIPEPMDLAPREGAPATVGGGAIAGSSAGAGGGGAAPASAAGGAAAAAVGSNVPTVGADGNMEFACNSCGQRMKAPVGSAFVRCPACTVINVNSQCGYCKKPVSFSKGTEKVKCPHAGCGKTNNVPKM